MAESDGGRPKLPLLKEGSRNLVTGTYLAEQISNDSYDLVCAGASQCRTHIGRAGAISPSPEGSPSTGSPRRRIKKSSNKFVKCTQLPALENIDTLFKVREDNEAADGKCSESEEGPSRLDRILEMSDSDDEDREFREWIKLPKLCETPKEDHEEPTEEKWHLLLSHKTFTTHSNQHVVTSLMQVLSLDPQTACDKTVELRKKRLVVLEEFREKGDAFRKLQKLRSLGLQVQVTMDSGLPGDGQLLEHRRRKPTKQTKSKRGRIKADDAQRSYTELFFRAGAERSTTGRWVQASSGVQYTKKRAGLAQWRHIQSGDFEQDVLPEDPVEALFLTERAKDRGQGGKSLFKVILAKHRTEITMTSNSSKKETIIDAPKVADTFLNALIQKPLEAPIEVKELVSAAAAAPPIAPSPVGDVATVATGQNSMPDALKPKEATPARKEACLLLRFFVFGGFSLNEDEKDTVREAIFHESIGTKEEVKKLHRIWCRLDDDNSGRADFSEFRVFADKHIREIVEHQKDHGNEVEQRKGTNDLKVDKVDKKRSLHHGATVMMQLQSAGDLLAQAIEDTPKFTATFCEKLSVALLGKKSSFVLEDMMRVVWLSASLTDTKVMKSWCRDFYEEAQRDRVETPPVLDVVEYEGLCSVFEHFDEDNAGEIHFDTLVTKGLIYNEQIEEYRKLWDDDGNGFLSMGEFVDMMCPVGFRATKKSEIGSLPDGRRVLFDPTMNSWKVERLPDDSHSEIVRENGKEPQDDVLQ